MTDLWHKMTFNEKFEDLQVKYLYVKKWSWNHGVVEVMQGVPKEGTVYRGLYNTLTKSYRLIISEPPAVTAILIDSLVIADEVNPFGDIIPFVCELVEITKQNILGMNLSEDDLDKIIKWQEIKGRDLITPRETALMSLDKAMKDQSVEDAERLHEALGIIEQLLTINCMHFELILELTDVLIKHNMEDYEDPCISLSEGEYGLSLNIGDVYRALGVYTSQDKRLNLDRRDLHEAFIGIVKELSRRDINGLDG